MPPGDPRISPAITWLIVLAGSLPALAFIAFFIVPNCARLPVRGKVSPDCGPKRGSAYVRSAMVLGAVVNSGYRCTRMVRDSKGESPLIKPSNRLGFIQTATI